MGSRARTASLRLCVTLSYMLRANYSPRKTMSTSQKTRKKTDVSTDLAVNGMDNDKAMTKVYELSYLISSAVPQEKVVAEKEKIGEILTKIEAVTIAGEDPEFRDLAYEIKRKVGAKNERFTQAYFGWVKFEAAPDKMDALKKSVESLDSVIRYLLVTTIRENTYLGKKASPVIRIDDKELSKDESVDLGVPATDSPTESTETTTAVQA